MEVCYPYGNSVSEDVNTSSELHVSVNDLQCVDGDNSVRDSSLRNIENSTVEWLQVQYAEELERGSNGDDANNEKGKILCERLEFQVMMSSQENFAECANSNANITHDEQNAGKEVEHGTKLQGTLIEDHLHTAYDTLKSSVNLKLVSAMKGSREKDGSSAKKLTVSWAPDVYDPPVTSTCHTVTEGKRKQRPQSKRSDLKKKSGKNKQKHHSSRVGRGRKDKRRPHKSSENVAR